MTKLLVSALLVISTSFMMLFQDVDTTPSGWPLQDENTGKITSGRGMRDDPFTGKRRYHKGIDISADFGTPVVATMDGEVQFVGEDGAHGYTIRISSNDYALMYAQLSEILVEQGATVQRGQVIAKVGSSGRSTAPHLHYEIWFKGKDVNPKEYIAEK